MGFIVETVFAYAVRGRYENRKCMLVLPLCPVYGLGVVLILLLPSEFRSSDVVVFASGALASTLAEYFMSFYYEKFLHVEFWNYRDMPLNIRGRVCLMFTIFWGILYVPLIGYIHPKIAVLVAMIPDYWALPAATILMADTSVSCYLLFKYETKEAVNLRKIITFRKKTEEEKQSA